ncbi:MAG: PilN domain-containing protein [Candidatus Omnitrophica bacterium]|nr:PilN domain-containing protein [Candidatus Omnitrophota bacterium]MCM8797974.1 PilN domain-containing protein [Candidatus Omnitrophota bacterium]
MKKRINLLPKELIKKEKDWTRGLKLSQIKMGVIIFLPLILWKLLLSGIIFKITSATHKKTKEIAEFTRKIDNLRASTETELKNKEEKLNLLKTEITAKEEEIKEFKPVVELLTRKEQFAYALLKVIAEQIPPEVWLTEIELEREGKNFSLKGIGLSHSKVALFLSRLNQFPYLKGLYLKESEIKSEEGNPQVLVHFIAEGRLNL